MSLLTNKLPWLVALCIGLGAAYFPGLNSDLIFDDQRLIDGTVFGAYGSLFDFKQRFLSYGSFVWFQQLFGDGWWKQRTINLLLHLGVAVSLFGFLRLLVDQVTWTTGPAPKQDPVQLRISKDVSVGIGVLVFAFNPAAAYAVAYLIQRSILMATLFSVISLYLTARAADGGGARFLLGAAAAYIAALFSKEHALMLPLVALAVFLVVRRPSRREAWFVASASLLLFAAAVGFLMAQYGAILGKTFDASSQGYVAQLAILSPGIKDQVFVLSVVNQSWLFFKYGILWFLPYVGWMSVDLRPPFPLAVTSFPQILGLPLFLALVAGSVLLMFRCNDWRRLLGLGVFAPAALFATEFATVWIQDPFVLYRSYLWAIGVPVLVAIPFVGVRPRTAVTVAAVLCAALGALTVERVLSLRTESVAWGDAAEKVDMTAPANAVGRWRPLVNRGNSYFQRGMPNVALNNYEAASRLGDPTGLADYHRGLILQQMGRSEEALAAFSQAAKSAAMPREFAGLPHIEQGKILFRLGRYEPAIIALDQALPLLEEKENRVVALKFRAQCNTKAGRPGEAVADYNRAVEINPTDRASRLGLALALSTNRQGEVAMRVLDSLQRENDLWDVHLGRAMVLEASGQIEKAKAEIGIGLRMNPSDPALQGFARKFGLKPN